MTMHFSRIALAGLLLLAAHTASADSFIGWQTFSNCGANNNSGICDSSPDSNSTFDATPVGAIGAGDTYLTGIIGTGASSVGRKGWGQNTNNGFLNGPGFGNETADSARLITNITLADGSPGERIGPQGGAGASSWKFGNSGNQRNGDVRLTNESDYYFQLTFLNFDARVGGTNSPHLLDINYLSGDGTAFDNNLVKLGGGELVNLKPMYNNDFGAATSTSNVSRSVGEAVDGKAYLAPGDSAAFRVIFYGQVTQASQSQLDNFAFQGKFFETAALTTEINPADVSVPEPSTAAMLLVGIAGLALRRRA
jgi:hypothetical protein